MTIICQRQDLNNRRGLVSSFIYSVGAAIALRVRKNNIQRCSIDRADVLQRDVGRSDGGPWRHTRGIQCLGNSIEIISLEFQCAGYK